MELTRLYKKELQTAKRDNWRKFCESIESTTEAARLKNVLASNHTSPTFIQKDDNTWAESSHEMNSILLNKHFLGCSIPACLH